MPELRAHVDLLRARALRPGEIQLLVGPPQIGKTTVCRALASRYLDWGQIADRRVILRGAAATAEHLDLGRNRDARATVGFDQLPAYRNWQAFLQGFRSHCSAGTSIIVTSRLALDGTGNRLRLPRRSVLLRLHPMSVGECAGVGSANLVVSPAAIPDTEWQALLEHGGFPEPFLEREARFSHNWQWRQRRRLLQPDLPELALLRDVAVIEVLVQLLTERSATALSYVQLSRETGASVDSIRRWIDLLVRLQVGFRLRPWTGQLGKALRKEPKWFLRDWSGVTERARRLQTLLACHLLKAVERWTDSGYGRFDLRYLRDKLGREVEFLVLKNRRPWFLAATGIEREPARALGYFRARIGAPYAFHVLFDAPYAPIDCFEHEGVSTVPARTFLSQLP